MHKMLRLLWGLPALLVLALGLLFPDWAVLVLVILGLLAGLASAAAAWFWPSRAATPARAYQAPAKAEAPKPSHNTSLNNIHQYQEELSGEVVNSIRGAVAISSAALHSRGRIQEFYKDFIALTGAIEAINSRIESLNQSVLTTSSATEQTAAAVEEITASIQRISEESQRRYGDIKDLVELANSGQREMEATRLVIEQVTAGIDDLRGFITVIEDIASRTGLLSMNAAIQAAHAGDAGKGFAVVADEVRKLAESSTENATRISKRLGGLIESINNTKESSQRTLQLLATTEQKVKVASDSFLEIQQGTQELDVGGKEILSATESLRDDSLTMKETMDTVRKATEEIASRVSHLKEASNQVMSDTESVHRSAIEVNQNSMVIAQSSIAQLQLAEKLVTPALADARESEIVSVPILILQHAVWVSRIRAVLDGTLSIRSNEVQNHRSCHLGQWIEKHGDRAFTDRELFSRFTRTHEELHQIALDCAALHEQGKKDEAELRYESMGPVSENIIRMIGGLAGVMEGGAKRNILLAWEDRFSVGQPQMDAQHRELVRLINALYEGLTLGRGKTVTMEILHRLAGYTQSHFHDEEKLFKASAYPESAAHLEEHRKLVSRVGELIANLESGRVVLGTDTLVFLKDWLTNHILGTDMGYRNYVKK